ncbi:uncharacterized protein CLUP02_11229 [Colletotrichum lupini]|uniref:Uncharacterized protein n=1 Tax=Colletotrichum lupini TaxID=145971 RepID=A0A9Q8WKA6_9PEZI|nr:uncharacterized protein CLUP02_11229 [Colletotrichum lupini]UQC85730.1 hypothetical protein CLUP02_11229 [Colletotrichum lupini]
MTGSSPKSTDAAPRRWLQKISVVSEAVEPCAFCLLPPVPEAGTHKKCPPDRRHDGLTLLGEAFVAAYDISLDAVLRCQQHLSRLSIRTALLEFQRGQLVSLVLELRRRLFHESKTRGSSGNKLMRKHKYCLDLETLHLVDLARREMMAGQDFAAATNMCFTIPVPPACQKSTARRKRSFLHGSKIIPEKRIITDPSSFLKPSSPIPSTVRDRPSSDAGAFRGKQAEESASRQEKAKAWHTCLAIRTGFTSTGMHHQLAAHGRSNNGKAAARLLFLSLPCFPPTPPPLRVPCIEALPAIFIQKQRRGRGRNCNVVEGEGERGAAKSRPPSRGRSGCSTSEGEGPRNVQEGTSSATRKSARLGEEETAAAAHRGWFKKFPELLRTTAQQQQMVLFGSSPIPIRSQVCAPFAPPGPVEATLGGRLWRPYSCISFAHVRVLCSGSKANTVTAASYFGGGISCESSSGRISSPAEVLLLVNDDSLSRPAREMFGERNRCTYHAA